MIWEANSPMLAAACAQDGGRGRLSGGGCRTTRTRCWSTLEDQLLPDADLLITSGGVSMGGEHDVWSRQRCLELGTRA